MPVRCLAYITLSNLTKEEGGKRMRKKQKEKRTKENKGLQACLFLEPFYI